MTDQQAPAPGGPLRRLADSAARRRWATFLVELVLIIVGIVAALAFDGWVDERNSVRAEKTYLDLLVRDLQQIEAELAEQIRFERDGMRMIALLYAQITAGDTGGRAAEIADMLSQLAARRTLFVDSAAYTDLLSTGNLVLIRDRPLRDRIIRYFTEAERSELVIEKNNKYIVDEGFGQFLVDFGVSNSVSISASRFVTPALEDPDSDQFYLEFMPNPPNAVLALPPEAPQWDELRRQLTWRASQNTAAVSRVTRMQDNTLQLREAIEAHLAERR